MTLTELKYIVALARERHFGRAAEACLVSQPTLSVAIKKLEDELAVQLFERGGVEITVTPIGARIVEQAQHVLEQTSAIRAIAEQGQDPLAGPLRIGVIYTIAPYLLPELVRRTIDDASQMTLLLQENFTVRLLELLRQGEIDVAILADPFPDTGLVSLGVYDEPFVVVVPTAHPWAKREAIRSTELKEQTMLLLGHGHCFRDHVLEVCPELSRYSQASVGIHKTFDASSLETIRHMVASGVGISVLPITACNTPRSDDDLLRYLPFSEPPPTRRVSLVWRKSFTRLPAIEKLREAILDCELRGTRKLPDEHPVAH